MKHLLLILVRCLPMAAPCPLLGACDGYISLGSSIGSAFSIGGTLSGLSSSQSIALLNNGRDSLTLAADSPFVFGGPMSFDGNCVVMISIQPASASCVVTNGSGRVNGNVNDVQVTCQPR